MSAISVTAVAYHTSNAPRKTHATYLSVPARILSSLVSSPDDVAPVIDRHLYQLAQ
jgi:hypothetical protein